MGQFEIYWSDLTNESKKGKYTVWREPYWGSPEVYDRVDSEEEADKIVREIEKNKNFVGAWYEKTGTTEKMMKELDPDDEVDFHY